MGQHLFYEVGLLQIGPAEGLVLSGVLASARSMRLEVETLSADEIIARFPGFRPQPQMQGVFERRAGYLLVEDCVRALAADAAVRRSRAATRKRPLVGARRSPVASWCRPSAASTTPTGW